MLRVVLASAVCVALIYGDDHNGAEPAITQPSKDDVAVLDGNVGSGNLAICIKTDGKLSNIEIAHLTIQNYGGLYTQAGALKLFRWGTGLQSHIYVHDVEMRAINRATKDASARIVCSFWGGPFTDVAIINNLVDGYASYFCRGAPPAGAGRIRFQNLTLKMFGTSGKGHVTGWKLWGLHNGRGISILPNASMVHKQNDYVIENNIIANTVEGDKNIEIDYAPSNLMSRGNVYAPGARFRWNETKHWVTMSFSQWKPTEEPNRDSNVNKRLHGDAASAAPVSLTI